MIGNLTPREELVWSLREKRMSLKDIAEKLQISRQRVSEVSVRVCFKMELAEYGIVWRGRRTIRAINILHRFMDTGWALKDVAKLSDIELLKTRGVGISVLNTLRELLPSSSPGNECVVSAYLLMKMGLPTGSIDADLQGADEP